MLFKTQTVKIQMYVHVCVSQQYMHIVCSAKKNIVSQWRVGCQWPYNDELLGLAGDPVGNAG